jgi:hypothetical protein
MADPVNLEASLLEGIARETTVESHVPSELEIWARAARLASWQGFDYCDALLKCHFGTESSAAEIRLKNYRNLASRVTDVFGDEIRASRWLSKANEDLEGKTPLQIAEEHDYRVSVLEPVLNRIEHGVDF